MSNKARNYIIEYWTYDADGAELVRIRVRTWPNADFGKIAEQLEQNALAGTTNQGVNWWLWGSPSSLDCKQEEQVIDLSGGYDAA
jgi:hypothetical protein